MEVYASDAASPTGHGEGAKFIGATDVDIGIAGENSFTLPLPGFVNDGMFITAIAIVPVGNTSEFSKAVQDRPSQDNPLREALVWATLGSSTI